MVASIDGATAITVDASQTSVLVPGLTNGTAYTFFVFATNSAGDGPGSELSDPVMPLGVPSAPLDIMAIAGDGQATVSWARPTSDGGSAILSYTITTSPGDVAMVVDASQLSVTVADLTNDTAYTFIVTAANSVGESTNSAASEAVTPIAP